MIDSLSNASYLNHLNQHELMTAQDELELGRQVQQGCFQARSEFIERNLKLVISIAGLPSWMRWPPTPWLFHK